MKKIEMIPTPISLPGLWRMYNIDDYLKIYRDDNGNDTRDAHKKVKKIYESLSSEEKNKINHKWFNKQFDKIG